MSKKINSDLTIIKVISGIILLLALLKMPYWYYQLLKITVFISFGYLAFMEFRQGVRLFPVLFLILSVIFAPFLELKLGRTVWNIVDVIAAIVLSLSILDSKIFRRFYD